ncbi:MAG TPA: aminotransferase class V-fold PLP-dependent enzyme [Anaerolineales bacterium]|nr:aminotransferase class V-fold PLP-dependent enzyme [Anaerolineales bacterium]
MPNLRQLFMLDPDIAYLNHGSFGATPEAVFREYQRWQRELELQPTEFLSRRHTALMRDARQVLGEFLGVAAQDVVFTQNITQAINVVAHSLRLGPGDEVLASDHEYGACDRIWGFLARKSGFSYVRRSIRLPLASREQLVDDFMLGVTPRTRVIFISHITGPTAILLPVEEICRRARLQGILTIVDGAHAPGQIALDLGSVGADFYGGNLHKWLCAPKGSGFLYAHREVQRLLEPLIISWGYESDTPGDSIFIDHHEWWGTRDVAAFLSVPAAIRFQEQHNWPLVRANCHDLLVEALRQIAELTGLPTYYPDDSWYSQMAAAPLPSDVDAAVVQRRLYDEYRVEAPVRQWSGLTLIRISLQAYNRRQDIHRLLEGLQHLI